MSQRDDFGSFLSGFLAGGMIGAVVALLMAPQSGEETRTYLKDKSYELRDTAVASAEDAYRRAEQAAAEARQRADELAVIARERAEELRNQGQLVLEEQRARLEGAVSAVRGKGADAEVELTEEKPAEKPAPKKKSTAKK